MSLASDAPIVELPGRDPLAVARRARASAGRPELAAPAAAKPVAPPMAGEGGAAAQYVARLDQPTLDRLGFLHKLWTQGKAGGKPMRLSAYDLSGLEFSGMDLTEVDLSGCSLRRSRCLKTNFRRAVLRGVDFDEADLGGADFERADMRQIRLATVNMISIGQQQTSFREAQLSGSRLARACMQGVDFTGAVLTNAVLADADMRGAVFVGADLTGVELRGSFTTESDFRGVTGLSADQREMVERRGARLARRIDPADPAFRKQLDEHRRWIDSGGKAGTRLVLEGCDLSHADFSGILFAAASLQYSSFAAAKLSGAIFAGADVQGVNFRKADLSGADLRGANIDRAITSMAVLAGAQLGELPPGLPGPARRR